MANIFMPSGGQTTNSSIIQKWFKKEGDDVNRGDVLFTIETDKAVLEVESYAKGKLTKIYYLEGESAETGEVVAVVGDGAEKAAAEKDGGAAKETAPAPVAPRVPDKKPATGKEEYQPISSQSPVLMQVSPTIEATQLASPRAKQAARAQNISLARVTSNGAVIKYDDVMRAVNASGAVSDGAAAESKAPKKVPLTAMRRIIAQQMTKSAGTIPHYYCTVAVEMDKAIKFRAAANERLKASGIKISFNDLIAKAAIAAIKKYPNINSTFDDDGITVYPNVNMGIAVGLDNGLVVPNVKNCEDMPLSELARQNAENIAKAKSGKFDLEMISHGTFTISNLGMFGIDSFTAVINYPEACILAVGQTKPEAVVKDGAVCVVRQMKITASFDHRIIDGAYGAAFLQEVKYLLENIEMLLL